MRDNIVIDDKLIELYNQGMCISLIAKEFGCVENTVRAHLRNLSDKGIVDYEYRGNADHDWENQFRYEWTEAVNVIRKYMGKELIR